MAKQLIPGQYKPRRRKYEGRIGSPRKVTAGRCVEKCFKLIRLIHERTWFTVTLLMEELGCARNTAQAYLTEASRFYPILALEKDEVPGDIIKGSNAIVYVLEENYEKVVDIEHRS